MNVGSGSSSHVILDFYNLRSSAGSANHVNERLRNFSTAELSEREKKLEIQRKNDLDKISPVKVESEPLWEEAEREDLGRILVASRDILPWEQVTTVTNNNYCGSVEFLRWLRIRHLCWLLQIGWFASSAFSPCLTNLTPALPVPGLSVVWPALAPLRSATMDLSAGC